MSKPTYEPGQGPPVNTATAISDVFRQYPDLLTGRVDELEGRIAQEVMERLRSSNRDSIYERQVVWPRNLLMTYGEQRIKWNTYGRRWVRRPPGVREKQFQTNVLLGRVTHMAAELTQARPTFQVVPKTPDVNDRRSAKLGERVLFHDYREHEIGNTRYLAILDALIFGMGIIEAGYDQDAGEVKIDYEVVRDAMGNPVRNEMGAPILVKKRGKPVPQISYEGANYVRNVSPFEFFTPPGVPTCEMNLCPWVIRVWWKSEPEIRKAYDLPDDFDFGGPDPEFEHIESVTGFLSRGQHGVGPKNEKRDTGLYLVVQYFERATDMEGFEEGKVYTCCNGKLINEERLAGSPSSFPFFVFGWVPKRGQFIPHAWITDQVELQMRYNQSVSHIHTWLSLFANPNILVPKGSGIPQQIAFNFRRYDFNPAAGPPQFWVPPAPNAAIFQAAESAIKDMDQVGSQFAFGRGEPVQGVPSARYAQYMQDADAKEIGPIVRMHARSMERLGEYILGLHKRFTAGEKMLRITGRSNRVELVSFQGSQLNEGLRVVVNETSMLSVIPSARIEQMRELVGSGFFGQLPLAPKAQRAVLEFIRMPELLDIETGDSSTERWLEDTLSRVIDQGEEIQLSPLWEEPLIQALKEALIERSLKDDAWDWDQNTVQAVGNFYGSIMQALNQFAEQREQEQDRQMQKQMVMQAAQARMESGIRTKEQLSGEIGKAGAQMLMGGQKNASPKPKAKAQPKAG